MDAAFYLSEQVIAFVITFVLALIAGTITIPVLKKLRFGQTVRDDGPASHLKKTGTPTMGGIIFLIPLLIVSFFYASKHIKILPLAITTFGFGLVGLIDDFIKAIRKHKDGFKPRQKMLGLVIIATLFTLYVAYNSEISTNIIVPLMGAEATFKLPLWFFIPFTIFVLLCTTNAVNFTDGLDGLAAGVTLIIMAFFTLTAMTRSEWDYIKIFSAIVAGGCLGFLAFNIHPAKVFMGDTGSLALGGAVGAISIMAGMPWIILIAGFVYVIELLSVVLQIVSFKSTGKRLFKMAPIHHHFELMGYGETKVVSAFWLATIVLCLISFLTLRIKLF